MIDDELTGERLALAGIWLARGSKAACHLVHLAGDLLCFIVMKSWHEDMLGRRCQLR